MRENVKISRRDKRIAVYLVAICICVVLGPFGTSNELPFWDRVVFWTVGITSVGVFMEVCILAALTTPFLEKLHFGMRLVIGATIGGLPGTSIIVFMNRVFRPEHLESATFPTLWVQVTFMAVVIATLDYFTSSPDVRRQILESSKAGTARVVVPAPETQSQILDMAKEPARETPRLLTRLEPHLRAADVISLSMQDHYVEVTTTAGSEMVLMRLVDAIELLDNAPGARIHRSHWVARAHAQKLRRDGRRHLLRTSDARELPVSKSYLSDISAMLDEKGQA